MKHTVEPGDTLFDLAMRFYGDPELWPKIAKANPGINPAALVIGSTVEVPELPGQKEEWRGPEPGYELLSRALRDAYDQSARGKGKERHANAKPFDKQPIMEIGRMVGVGYHTGQIMKKVQEATTMAGRGNTGAAKAELLGAIVYSAAAYLLIEESEKS